MMAIYCSMAIPKIKATYSLDEATIRQLERVSRRWGVSKSEAIRRAIAGAAAASDEGDPRLDALDRLQSAMQLSRAGANAWIRRVREERGASEETRRKR